MYKTLEKAEEEQGKKEFCDIIEEDFEEELETNRIDVKVSSR